MKPLLLKDKIYGEYTITSPVFIELINSKPVQRLRKITQYGTPYKIHHLKQFTRYDHSIGTMLLLKHLGATEEEQIAGLLHDVSHTAFSHVIDWVVGNEHQENYQDLKHKDFIRQSEIATILKKFHFDVERIAHYENFTLLEQSTPKLCADRADYALREFKPHITKKCIAGMIVKNKSIVFKDKESALLFGTYYLRKQMTVWGSFESGARYHFFARALKIALQKKIITFDDFWQYDTYILTKLKNAENAEINHIFTTLMRIRNLSLLPKTKLIYYPKFRYVDPEIVTKSKIQKLSTLYPDFMKLVEKNRMIHSKGICIPTLP